MNLKIASNKEGYEIDFFRSTELAQWQKELASHHFRNIQIYVPSLKKWTFGGALHMSVHSSELKTLKEILNSGNYKISDPGWPW